MPILTPCPTSDPGADLEFNCQDAYPGDIFEGPQSRRLPDGGPARRPKPPGQDPPPGTPDAPESPQAPAPTEQNDCEAYSKLLTELVQQAGRLWGVTTVPDVLMFIGFNDVMRRPNKIVSGFKESLVEHGQGSDVFKHLNWGIGSILSGQPQLLTGLTLVDAFEIIRDRGNRREQLQRLTEIKDDFAAARVGVVLMSAVITQDFKNVQTTVSTIICKGSNE